VIGVEVFTLTPSLSLRERGLSEHFVRNKKKERI